MVYMFLTDTEDSSFLFLCFSPVPSPSRDTEFKSHGDPLFGLIGIQINLKYRTK